jgi:Reverse transcriptase (RNA-dependent DNA polymerase)/Endonuclease-reverse transcriptase
LAPNTIGGLLGYDTGLWLVSTGLRLGITGLRLVLKGLRLGTTGLRLVSTRLRPARKTNKGGTKTPMTSFKVAQRNMQGLKSKQDVTLKYLIDGKIDAALLMETFMTDAHIKEHKLTGYYAYHRMRDANGTQSRGGATILVKDSGVWKHTEIHRSPKGNGIESITVAVSSSDGLITFYLTAAYLPPGENITVEQLHDAIPTELVPLDAKWLIGADINAHHELWDSFIEPDTRGETMINYFIEEDLTCNNDPEKPTRSATSKTGEKHSSPDVTLSRNLQVENWTTESDMHSDHNWVIYDLDGISRKETSKRTYWALPKADWTKFATTLDKLITAITYKRIDNISQAMLVAMKIAVPKGNRKDPAPLWTPKMDEAEKLSTKADQKLRANPSEENMKSSKAAKMNMIEVFRSERRHCFWEKFQESQGKKEIWRLLRNMQSKIQISKNTVIKTDTTELKTDRQKAEAFAKKFANVSRRTGPRAQTIHINTMGKRFTLDEFLTSLKRMKKGKAVGHDELPIEAVIHMSEQSKLALLEAINWSYLHGDCPLIWKRGIIIPALKPDKDATDIGSYRPITLTSQISKLMERMVARRIIFAIQKNLHHTQFGFRAGLSTVDALMEIVDEMVRGFDTYDEYVTHTNEGKRTNYTYQRSLAVLIDFTSAFDTIGHHAVLQQLETLGCGQYDLRWVRSFLTGRQGKVQVNDTTSVWHDFESGVPQGTVLGPLLFIVALNDLLVELTSKKIRTACFADDLTMITRSNQGIDVSVQKAQEALDVVDRWTQKSCMIVNIKKTYGLLGSTNANPSQFDKITKPLTYQGKDIRIFHPGDKLDSKMTFAQSRLLGLHLDHGLTFFRQVTKVKQGVTRARQAMSRLSGSTFGAPLKMLAQFHNVYARSRELYGMEVYYHLLSSSNKEKIASMDRECIRQAVGLMPGATEQQLIYESRIRPLDIEIKMRQANYFERTIRLGEFQKTRAMRQAPACCKQNHSDNKQYTQVPMQVCREAAETVLKWAKIDPHTVKRANLVRNPSIAPWARAQDVRVKIITQVKPGVAKSKITKEEQHKYVAEVVEHHLKTATIQFWCDGSSHLALRKSGAAATIYKKIEGKWEPHTKCASAAGSLACSFTAEGAALRNPLIELENESNEIIVGFIDCQSLLVALDSRSIDQEDEALEYIWKLLLTIGRKNTVILQHVFSHCDIEQSDEVDESANTAALTFNQDGVPMAYRDAKALIKAWAKSMTAKRLQGHRVPENMKKRKEEAYWSREEQVTASQLRAKQVRIVGEWPRRFDKEMALSCRFCTPEDHVTVAAEEAAAGPRSSKEKVMCTTCNHEYSNAGKFNDHLKTLRGETCSKEQTPIFIKARKPKNKPPTDEPVEKKIVERRPSTGPEETLEHVLSCKEVEKAWGKNNGTLREMVKVLVNMKHFFDEKREEQSKKGKKDL